MRATILMVMVFSEVLVAQTGLELKTYNNVKMGFEVKHPEFWYVRLSEGTMESVSLSKTPQVGVHNVSIQFIVQRDINPQVISIDKWYSNQLEKHGGSIPGVTVTNTVVGGRQAILMKRESSLGKHYTYYVARKNGDIFQVSIIGPASQDKLEKEIENILAAIKFIN